MVGGFEEGGGEEGQGGKRWMKVGDEAERRGSGILESNCMVTARCD